MPIKKKCEKNQNTECQSEYIKGLRPGWLALRKLWHSETTPFKKIHDKLKKIHSETEKATETKHKRSFVREACVASFPTWSSSFQIEDTCTHCVPIFVRAVRNKGVCMSLATWRLVNFSNFPHICLYLFPGNRIQTSRAPCNRQPAKYYKLYYFI